MKRKLVIFDFLFFYYKKEQYNTSNFTEVKEMKKIILLTLILSILMTGTAFADEILDTGTENADDVTGIVTEELEEETSGILEDMTSEVDMDTLNEAIDEKGEETLAIVKKVGLWMVIIIFIVGLLITLVGIFTGKSIIGKGIAIMFTCASVFCGIYYAESIMAFFKQWITPTI